MQNLDQERCADGTGPGGGGLLRPRLVVGLGNPGADYADSRHNVGFKVIERVLAGAGPGAREKPVAGGMMGGFEADGQRVWTLRPLTYMNRSGEVVAPIVAGLGLQPAEMLVVYDCLDLPLGRLRLRRAGSSGGHRGVESILQALTSAAVPRLRVGIGRPGQAEAVEYVLSPWCDAERALADAALAAAAEAVWLAVRAGVDVAMNRFNGWRADGPVCEKENGPDNPP